MLSTLKKQVHSRQKALIIAALSLIFSACIALPWLFRHAISENARFENFAESLFEKEVSGNVLNLHYSLANPEKQGISRPRASLGTLATDNSNAIRQYEQYEAKLKTFSPAKLSQTNRLTLDMLLLYYHTQASLGEHYLLEEPLGPSLGIQVQLPVLLAEYNFYNNQDITDYLNLLTTTGDYFQSILAFERAKSDTGFFMSDETLDRIQTQCRSFIQDPDSNYMLEIFSQKLKDYGKLSEKDQKQLNQAHRQILKEKVLPAYQKLIEGLEAAARNRKKLWRPVQFFRWKRILPISPAKQSRHLSPCKTAGAASYPATFRRLQGNFPSIKKISGSVFPAKPEYRPACYGTRNHRKSPSGKNPTGFPGNTGCRL